MPPPLYLDYQATTPLDPDVLAVMMPYLTTHFGNPHSAEHRFGWETKAAVDVARRKLADMMGAPADTITFTSGATEANNLALRGSMALAAQKRQRIVTLATEHSCVLETAHDLHAEGYDLTVLPVQPDGLLDVNVFKAALADDVAMVSIMLVNNEIGVIQPIAELAALTHASGALFHCDAAQALGKISVDVQALGVDLMSLSAHKLYGPKGIGALYVREGVRLKPQISGGGQQHGVRSGTLAPMLCAGFGKAADMASGSFESEHQRYTLFWQQLVGALTDAGINHHINGTTTARFFGNLNISFPGLDGSRLLADLRGVAVSSAAACASAEGKASYVLAAIGAPEGASLRMGFGRPTTPADVEHVTALLIAAVRLQTHL